MEKSIRQVLDLGERKRWRVQVDEQQSRTLPAAASIHTTLYTAPPSTRCEERHGPRRQSEGGTRQRVLGPFCGSRLRGQGEGRGRHLRERRLREDQWGARHEQGACESRARSRRGGASTRAGSRGPRSMKERGDYQHGCLGNTINGASFYPPHLSACSSTTATRTACGRSRAR